MLARGFIQGRSDVDEEEESLHQPSAPANGPAKRRSCIRNTPGPTLFILQRHYAHHVGVIVTEPRLTGRKSERPFCLRGTTRAHGIRGQIPLPQRTLEPDDDLPCRRAVIVVVVVVFGGLFR